MSYGVPTGAAINYGAPGFPDWVYQLGQAFGLRASTYPGHQENDRVEAGYARNPDRLNRGIDWAGPVDAMQRFAEYCLSIRGALEQVIWQNPNTGQRVGVAGGQDVTQSGYYSADYGGHTDHVHTRQSEPIPMPGSDYLRIKVLYDAVPVISMARAAELVGAVRGGLVAAQCTNAKRIAMYLAQCGHESDGFATTEEYADGSAYDITNDRQLALQLGNTQPGDGPRFKGRSWIQVTGRSNYQAFSQWAYDNGITTDNAYFVNNPTALAELQYAGIGSAWYWTVARPDINTLSDAGDVTTVTRRINGGTNGLQDRVNRYNQAIALGDRLLTLITPTQEGPLMALSDDEQTELLTKVRYIFDQLGPKHPDWGQNSSLGVGDDGSELTLRDGIAEMKRKVDSPEVAIVSFQTAEKP